MVYIVKIGSASTILWSEMQYMNIISWRIINSPSPPDINTLKLVVHSTSLCDLNIKKNLVYRWLIWKMISMCFQFLSFLIYFMWIFFSVTFIICMISLFFFPYRWYIFEESILDIWTGIMYISFLKANTTRQWYTVLSRISFQF